MTERLLDQSTLLETIILRPGDLVDEERVRFMLRVFSYCIVVFFKIN